MTSRKKTIDFETRLQELEDLVEALESGDLSLEESLKAFEKGIRITRDCQQALTEAEQKVNLLTRNGDAEVESQPFAEPPAS